MTRAALAVLTVAVATTDPAIAVELRGRVLVDGRPLAGATIAAVPFESPLEEGRREARRADPPKPLGTATTGGDGFFALAWASTGPPMRLRVSAPGQVAVVLARVFDPGYAQDAGEITLPRVRALTGRAVDPGGGPVVGASVTLRPGNGSGPAGDHRLPATTTAGADGAFRFEAATASGNRVRVEAPGLAAVELVDQPAGALRGAVALSVGRTLRGTVLLPDGRTPAGGAVVRFEGPATTRWTETRPDGVFLLEGVPTRAGTLVAEAGERGHGSLPVDRDADALKIVLAPSGALRGRVVDAQTGKPLPRVRVTALADDDVFTAASGADGGYEVTGLAGRRYTVAVDDPRYVAWRRRAVSVQAGQALAQDIALTGGAALSGRVVDETGAPIEGAVARVLRPNDRGMPFRRGPAGDEPAPQGNAARTGKDGTFKATRLPPGDNQRVVVQHDDRPTLTVGGISLVPGATRSGLTIVLPKGLSLRGSVKDEADRPVAGADLDLVALPSSRGGFRGPRGGPPAGDGLERRPRIQSGPDGRFEFKGLSAGDWALSAGKPGFAKEVVDPVKVAEATKPVEVVLRAGAAIAGYVRDDRGSGLAGYRVAASRPGAWGRGLLGATASDPTGPDGAFRIEGLDAEAAYDLQAMGEAGRGPRKAGVVAPAEAVELAVASPGRIRGAVSDGEGKPVTDFQVSFTAAGRGRGGIAFGAGFGTGGPGPLEPLSVRSDDGTFVLENVPPGRWTVEASAKGYQAGRAAGVVVEEGGVAEGIAIRLEKGGTIGGRVLENRTGQPVADASLEARLAGGTRAAFGTGQGRVETDADGRFEVGGLAPGTYTLTARHPDWSDVTTTVELKDATASAELRLGSGGSLSGTVQAAGRPVVGATVSLGGGRGPGGGQTAVTDVAGRFAFDRLAAGRYQVTAAFQGQASLPVDAVLPTANATQDVSLTLGGGATIRGVVAGLPDAQLPGVRVSASGPEGYAAASRTGPGGVFELTGAPPGSISLRAQAGDLGTGLRTAGARVDIADGQVEAAAQIEFDPGFRLTGRVTRAGAPVGGATVGAAPQGGPGGLAAARTNDAGDYALEGLAEGSYTVTVMSPDAGGSPVRRPVDVAGDTTLDVDMPSARIAGTVVEAGSLRPLADAVVQVQGARRGSGSVVTDSSGRFAMEGLDPRAYPLTVRKPAYETDTREVAASEDSELRIELRRGEGIGLVARDGLYRMALRSLFVRVADAQGTAVFSSGVSLDGDGRGEIPSLKPGTYAIRIESPGYASIDLPEVSVPSPVLQVALTPGGTVDVVAGPKTLAIPGATAQLVSERGDVSEGRIRLSGPVQRLDHVAPGHYTLVATTGESRSVDVQEGARTTVSLP